MIGQPKPHIFWWLAAALLLVGGLILVFWPRSDADLYQYVYPDSQVLVSFRPSVLPLASRLANWPVSDWPQQLQQQSNTLADRLDRSIRQAVWFSDGQHEGLVVELNKSLGQSQQSSLAQETWISWFWQQDWQISFPDARLVLLTAPGSSTARPSGMTASLNNWPARSLLVSWQTDGLKKILGAHNVDWPLFWPAADDQGYQQLIWQPLSNLEKLTLKLPLTGDSGQAPALFFPQQFDTYLLISQDLWRQLSQSDWLAVKTWSASLDSYLQTNFNLSLAQLNSYLGFDLLFIKNDKNWLLATAAADLRQLGGQLASYLKPRLQLSKLPDNSVYRELVRNQIEPERLEVNGRSVEYWGEVAENRIYFLPQGGKAALTNDLALLEGSLLAKEAAVPAFLTDCLAGQAGLVQGLIWLPQEVSGLTNLALVDFRTAEERQLIACLGQ